MSAFRKQPSTKVEKQLPEVINFLNFCAERGSQLPLDLNAPYITEQGHVHDFRFIEGWDFKCFQQFDPKAPKWFEWVRAEALLFALHAYQFGPQRHVRSTRLGLSEPMNATQLGISLARIDFHLAPKGAMKRPAMRRDVAGKLVMKQTKTFYRFPPWAETTNF